MPYRLLSRCCRISFLYLCLWSTLAYLWCFITTDALIAPRQYVKYVSGSHYGVPSVGSTLLNLGRVTEAVRTYSSPYDTSIAMGYFSHFHTMNWKFSKQSATILLSSTSDSTFEESDFETKEMNDALDNALGEVRSRIILFAFV